MGNICRPTTQAYEPRVPDSVNLRLQSTKHIKKLVKEYRIIIDKKKKGKQDINEGLNLIRQLDNKILTLEIYSKAFPIISQLKPLLKELRFLPPLKELIFDASNDTRSDALDMDIFNNLSDGLMGSFSLTRLYLNFNGVILSSEKVKTLGVCISRLHHLKHLGLNFSNLSGFTDIEGIYIIQGISKLSSLTLLNLNFANNKTITTYAMVELGQVLRKLETLASLTLNFENNSDVDNQGLFEICEGVSKLTRLGDLSLDMRTIMSDGALEDEEGNNIMKSLFMIIPRLRSFELCLNVGKINDLTLGLLVQALSEANELSTFKLTITENEEEFDTNVTNQSLRRLGDAIANLGCLTKLTLKLTGLNKITNEGMNYVFEQISSISDLSSLELAPRNINEVEYIARTLQELNSLAFLSLKFPKELGPIETISIVNAISKHKSLMDLSLEFNDYKGFHFENLNILANLLSNLSNLKKLELDLCGVEINQNGAALFGSTLGKLKNLNELSIWFNSSRMKDYAVTEILQGIAKLFGLEILKLTFYDNDTLGGISLDNLEKTIKFMAKLNTLKLDMRGTNAIKEKGLSSFIRAIRDHPNLINFEFNFDRDTFDNYSQIQEYDAICLELDPRYEPNIEL